MVMLIVFLIPLFLWGYIAQRSGKTIHSSDDYFFLPAQNESKDRRRLAISFVVSNLAISAIVIPSVLSGRQYGFFFLVVPIAFCLSNVLFAAFHIKRISLLVDCGGTPKHSSVLAKLDRDLGEAAGSKSYYARVVNLSLAIFSLIFIGYEIFVASEVIIRVLNISSLSGADFLLISFLLFGTSLWCVYRGGLKGVLETDKLQFLAALFFLVVLLVLTLSSLSLDSSMSSNYSLFPSLSSSNLSLLTVFVANVLLSPYINLNTLYLSENIRISEDQRPLRDKILRHPLFWGSLITLLLSLFLAAIGILQQGIGPLDWFPVDDQTALYLKLLVLLSVPAIVVSTVDNLMISALYHSYPIFLSREQQKDDYFLDRLKLLLALLCSIPYSIALLFHYMRPDLLLTIVSISSSLVVYAPLTILCVQLSTKKYDMKIVSNRLIGIFFLLFICSAFYAVLYAPTLDPLFNLIFMIISSGIAFGVWIRAKRSTYD